MVGKRYSLSTLRTLSTLRFAGIPLTALLAARAKMTIFLSQPDIQMVTMKKELEDLSMEGLVEIKENSDGRKLYSINEEGIRKSEEIFDSVYESSLSDMESTMDTLRIALWFYPDRAISVIEARLKRIKAEHKLADECIPSEGKSFWEHMKERSRVPVTQKIEEHVNILENEGHELDSHLNMWPGDSGAWAKEGIVLRASSERGQLEFIREDLLKNPPRRRGRRGRKK